MNGCMEKINILTNFFDITTEHEHSLSCIQKYFDSSCCGLYINNVLSKTQALAIITKEFQSCPEFSELMISSDAVKENAITDFSGQKIFQETEPWISGWLFFYNPCTFMNWEHECEYWFIASEDKIVKHTHTKAPGEDLHLQSLKRYQNKTL